VEELISPSPDTRPTSARDVLARLDGLGGRASARLALAELVRALSRRDGDPSESTRAIDLREATVVLEEPLPATEPLPPASTTRPLAPKSERAPHARALHPVYGLILVGAALAAATWLALTGP